MPDLGVELDDGRLERVHVRDDDIDLVLASSVGGVGRSGEGSFNVREVGWVDRISFHERDLVVMYVC